MGKKREIHHGNVLRNQLKLQNVQVKELSEYIGVSRGTLSKWMKSQVLNKSQITLVCYALDLTPKDFHTEHGVIRSYEPSGNLTKHLGFVENTKYVKYGRDLPANEASSQSKEYFNILNSKLEGVKNRISIYEYLDMTTSPKLLGHNEFKKGSMEYLDKVVSLHVKENVVYRRIFALPIDIVERNPLLKTLKIEMEEMELSSFEIDLVCLVHLLFGLSMQHLGKCFRLFGERMNLYLLHSTTVKYSYKIIDDSSIIFHHSRYGKYSNDVRPDFLLLHTVTETHTDPDIQSMIRSFDEVFNNLVGHALEPETAINAVSIMNIRSGLRIYHNLVDMALIRYSEKLQAIPDISNEDYIISTGVNRQELAQRSAKEIEISRLNSTIRELKVCQDQINNKMRAFNAGYKNVT